MNGSLSSNDIRNKIQTAGLCIQIGPFSVRARSSIASVAEGIERFYGDYPLHDQDFCDFHVGIHPPSGIRRWHRPQVNFHLDDHIPFKPMPKDQAFATFEWGLNYCISSYAQEYLIIHSAVVEKNGLAIIMPAQPGSGKSTLTAALVSRGWRLLSDELTLIPLSDRDVVVPITRPINIKNASIEVIKSFAPEQTFGTVVNDTAKGTVTHMKPPTESIDRINETAQQRLIIFPQFRRGSDTHLTPRSKAQSFMEMAQQSFNFNILGKTGFETLKGTVSRCDCYDFRYSSLEEAMTTFDTLINQQDASLKSDTLTEDIA